MIHFITSRKDQYDEEELNENGIEFTGIIEFNRWFKDQTRIQLDTETNVVELLYNRELYLVQIGDEKGEDQWIFDIVDLSPVNRLHLKKALASDVTKVIHNALFEYTIIKKEFGIDIKKIRDTYLMSRILHTGLKMPKGFHGLSGCLTRYFNIELDKEEQSKFDREPHTVSKLLYAAKDVAPLCILHDNMQVDIDKWDLENVVRLECALVRPYGDAMWENFYLDIPKWRGLITDMEQRYDATLKGIYEILQSEFLEGCQELGFIQKDNAYLFNWRSTKMKKDLLKLFYPTIPDDCTTLPKIKAYLKTLHEDESSIDTTILENYLNKNYTFIEQQLVSKHQSYLEEKNLFIPKGKILINFSSPEQVLRLFQLINPKLEKVNKKALTKMKHPLVTEYKSLKKYGKLVTSYGENFIKAVSPDGMLRINSISQILNTGRTSLKLYQLLPSDKGSKHRNCFYPPKGYKVCINDFASQELVITATISGDERMLNALKKGHDLHSISASIVFPDEWLALGEDPYPTGKPKTKEGDEFRTQCKKVTFGLLYGKSAIGLAEDLNLFIGNTQLQEYYQEEFNLYIINNTTSFNNYLKEFCNGKDNLSNRKLFFKFLRDNRLFHSEIITADDLIKRIKDTYPQAFQALDDFGIKATHLFRINTQDVFARIRFFEPPANNKEVRAIQRAAGNQPIQSSAANMMKYAIVKMKEYTEQNNLSDVVKFALPLHDESVYIVREDFAEEWLEIQQRIMEEAGEFILGNKLQKSEGKVALRWEK